MQSELKPCAHCGGEAKLFHHSSAGLEPSWHVECSNVDGVYEGCGCGTCHHETAAEAITTWNARASDAEITRLTEALRAAEERERGLREALGEICRDSNPDWTERRVYPNDVLDDIHKIAVDSFYGIKL